MKIPGYDLRPKFDEYKAAGKFDYLKSFSLTEIEFSVRTYNCLKSAEIKSLYDLIELDTADFRRLRNFGKNGYTEIQETLPNYKAFIYSGNNDKTENFPTFENLYNSDELDTYIAEGEALAGQNDPKWRKKLALTVPQPTVDEKLEEFIRNKAQTDFSDEQKKLLMMPVDELNLPEGSKLKNMAEDDATLILAEIIYNGSELLREKGYDSDDIRIITEDVQALGFAGIGFRRNAEETYLQKIHIDEKVFQKQEEYKVKFGF